MRFTILIVALLLGGCATYNSNQTELVSTNGTRTVTTVVRISTVFDAKSDLAKLNLSTTEKSQRLGLGTLNQESTSSNLVSILEAVARGAAAGAK